MKRSLTSVLVVLVCAISLFSLSSCTQDDPYTSPLVGRWEAFYNQSGDIYRNDYSYTVYTFYDNGTGYLEYWNVYNRWVGVRFDWDSYNNSYVNIRYYDNSPSESLYFQFINRNLELSESPSFRTYTGYRYAG